MSATIATNTQRVNRRNLINVMLLAIVLGVVAWHINGRGVPALPSVTAPAPDATTASAATDGQRFMLTLPADGNCAGETATIAYSIVGRNAGQVTLQGEDGREMIVSEASLTSADSFMAEVAVIRQADSDAMMVNRYGCGIGSGVEIAPGITKYTGCAGRH